MLTIGDLAERVGLRPGTLREWERRHGFPVPERLPSGHRRYRESAVDEVRAVVERQRAGYSLSAAISAVRTGRHDAPVDVSIFAEVAATAGREPIRLTRRAMLAFSRAIEDACAASGGAGVIVGSFQRELAYRACEPRWNELARSARVAVAFADFAGIGGDGVVEVPIAAASPLRREWAVAVASPRLAACLAGWEWPGSTRFEATWTVDPDVVRSVIERPLAVARRAAPDRVPDVADLLDRLEPDLGTAMRLLDRVVERLDRSVDGRRVGRDVPGRRGSGLVGQRTT